MSKLTDDRIRITFFQRKTRPTGNFSLEFIFNDVRNRLKKRIEPSIVIAPYCSNGLFRRVAILCHAWLNQARRGGVNHVTGDTTFAAIDLNRNRTALTILDCGGLADCVGLKRSIIKYFWFAWPVKHAATVTTISSSVKKEIIELTRCDCDKVRVVPVAVSDKFSRHEKPFCHDNPRILHLGNAPNKNLLRLVEAIKGISCVLVVIGKLDDAVLDSIRKYGIVLENHYNLDLDEVVQQYSNCDIVSFVSTYEGFGMPIVEANIVGRPVITGNCSSMPEVAGDAALLVDPLDSDAIRDGIQRLISDSELRTTLIGNGYENAKRFHGDKIAEMYFEIYSELTKQ